MSQKGIHAEQDCGYKLSIPNESIVAGVPISENPNQLRVDFGPSAEPISLLSRVIPAIENKLVLYQKKYSLKDYVPSTVINLIIMD